MKKQLNFWLNVAIVRGTIFRILGIVAAMMLLTGCGHNIGTAFKGKAANLGYDPEFNKFGIQYYDGIIVTGLNKEKTETHLEFTDSAETQGGKTSANMTYTHKTGDQVTGYVVDLEEVKTKNQTK
jgi:hypothetical protein